MARNSKNTAIIILMLALVLGGVGSASAATIDGVSDSSVASSIASWFISLFVTNNNNATIVNNVSSTANTGGNTFVSADDQSGTSLTTGNAQSATLVDNAANNNMISQEYESSNGSDDMITNVQDESVASSSLTDTNDGKVENKNDVAVENNVDSTANTGTNLVSSGDSLKDASSLTGRADAVTGVTNLFNFNVNEIIRRIRSTIAP